MKIPDPDDRIGKGLMRLAGSIRTPGRAIRVMAFCLVGLWMLTGAKKHHFSMKPVVGESWILGAFLRGTGCWVLGAGLVIRRPVTAY